MQTIGYSAFSECSGLIGALVIPDSVTYIGQSAFYGCTGLTALVIGCSANIESDAFSQVEFSSILNIGTTTITDNMGVNPSIVKDSLVTAGTIQAISNKSGGDSSGSNNGMTNTILRLIPLFAMLGVLIGFAVPLVSNRFE